MKKSQSGVGGTGARRTGGGNKDAVLSLQLEAPERERETERERQTERQADRKDRECALPGRAE